MTVKRSFKFFPFLSTLERMARKNAKIAHFVLKNCTFRFRDYTCTTLLVDTKAALTNGRPCM